MKAWCVESCFQWNPTTLLFLWPQLDLTLTSHLYSGSDLLPVTVNVTGNTATTMATADDRHIKYSKYVARQPAWDTAGWWNTTLLVSSSRQLWLLDADFTWRGVGGWQLFERIGFVYDEAMIMHFAYTLRGTIIKRPTAPFTKQFSVVHHRISTYIKKSCIAPNVPGSAKKSSRIWQATTLGSWILGHLGQIVHYALSV